MTKFKVGDVVIGNKLANDYGITVEGWKGEVVDTDPQSINNIFVKDLATKDKYWVDSNCFDMYKEAPKKEFKDLDDNERYWVDPKIFEDSKDLKGMVNVSVDFIKQAYQMADPELRTVMEEEFKDLFKKEDAPFNFGDQYTLGTSWNDPLIIGKGLAPKGLEGRCLVVRSSYDLEVVEENDLKILIFREKK
ncbi:MAG: hypothetical protein EBY80_12175 [Actinobacteria bacterium]|nr:hypothetical protein [Actinomycetota bacterium]